MDSGAALLTLALILTLAALGFVLFATIRSIQVERTKGRSVWKEFGLGLALMTLFFMTWIGQLITQWQVYTDHQSEHGEATQIGDFLAEFAQSTLENWQSEFLQLFAFVTLAALYIHKGSAESKDGTEKIEAALRRVEEKLGTLPDTAPKKKAESWKLPDTPLELND